MLALSKTYTLYTIKINKTLFNFLNKMGQLKSVTNIYLCINHSRIT
jgi:hypothetical protein